METNTSSNSTSHKEFIRITNVLPVKVLSIVNSDNNGHRYRGEAMFVVQNISFKDEGEYICEAFNERGKTKCGAFIEVIKGKLNVLSIVESTISPQWNKAVNYPMQ